MTLVAFTLYTDNEARSATVHINPAEVAAVKPWWYHSFRSPIAEIVLQSGEKIRVWQNVETVVKRLGETT